MKKFKKIAVFSTLALALFAATAGSMAACGSADASDLMSGVAAGPANGKPPDPAFIESMANFSVELFKNSMADQDNSLISPLSAMLALAMAANGAEGETLAQMESLLGRGIPLGDLNEYLKGYARGLSSGKKSKLNIANSIWFRDDEDHLQVSEGFLQRNADYYGASAHKAAFDGNTLKSINGWVKSQTGGMIDKMLLAIKKDAVMYLLNAVAFDAEWQDVYSEGSVCEGLFTDVNGENQDAEFMNSVEYIYLEGGRETGFVKPYAGGTYSFAALLPDAGIPIGEYARSLSGAEFLNLLENAQSVRVNASMPRFEFACETKMNEVLKGLGMPLAFDPIRADFSRMATSPEENIYISEALHKAFIAVDELGTKAGAATKVVMETFGTISESKSVTLDRPFLFAIIDNATNLPVFLGTALGMAI